MMPITAIELRNVSVRYGTRYVIRDINLAIVEGSIVGIIGHSGSGKTTLLRVIAGFEKSDNGNVTIYGKDMKDVEPAERGVGYIFQNYTLFPHLSVFDNVAFGLKSRKVGKSDIQEKVDHVTGFLNIRNLLAKYPHQLSGGEQQRVAIARSMVLGPKILLLDESFSNLDYNLKIELLNQLKRINKDIGTTILYVTHDQTDCFGLCDKIVVVKDGIIVEADQTINIINSPRTKEVASFVGIYQALDANVVARIISNNYDFSSSKTYYIKKNRISLVNFGSQDLSVSGAVTEIVDKSFYHLVKVTIAMGSTVELVMYSKEHIEPGDQIKLFMNSQDLIIYENEEASGR